MNNCPKCGNPLQPGTSSCPICGTEIEGVSSATTQMTVASVAKPTTTVAPTVQVATPQATQQQPAKQPVAAPQGQQSATQTQQVVAVQPQNAQTNQTPIAPQVDSSAPNNEVQVVVPQVVKVDETPAAPSNASVEPVVQPTQSAQPTPVVVQTDNVEVSAPQPQVVTEPAQAPVSASSQIVVAPKAEAVKPASVPQGQPTVQSTSTPVQGPAPVVTEQVVTTPVAPVNAEVAPVQAPVPTQPVEQVVTPQVTPQLTVPQQSTTTVQSTPQQVSQPVGTVNTQPEFSQPAPVAMSPQDANSSQSVVQDTTTPVTTDDKKGKKEKGPKKPINKNVIIIAVFVLFVVGAGIFMLTSKGLKKNPKAPNSGPVALKGDIVTSNGYKFTLAEGWIITEGNGNVIVSNPTNSENKKEAATVQLRLTHADSNIEEITEDVLKKYAENNENLVDAEIVKKEISSKDAYLVNAKVNDLPIQIYFIGGGTRLLLGVTVVYDNKEAKDNYENVVLQMVETLSYSDDSIKALDVVGMYKDVFDIYGKVIDYYKYSYGKDIADNSGENENNPENQPQGEQSGGESEQNPPENPPVATEIEPQTTEIPSGENPTN